VAAVGAPFFSRNPIDEARSFEGLTINAGLWYRGAVTIDTTRACRGNQSLHASTFPVDGGNVAAILPSQTFPLARTTVFLRAYVYLLPSQQALPGPKTTLSLEQHAAPFYGVWLEQPGALNPVSGLNLPPSTQPIDHMVVGLAVHDNSIGLSGLDIWSDDFVAANQRVGCGN
jgi:hypothetical protein